MALPLLETEKPKLNPIVALAEENDQLRLENSEEEPMREPEVDLALLLTREAYK